MLVKKWMRVNFKLLDHLPKQSMKFCFGEMSLIRKEMMLLNKGTRMEKEVLMGASANATCSLKVLVSAKNAFLIGKKRSESMLFLKE